MSFTNVIEYRFGTEEVREFAHQLRTDELLTAFPYPTGALPYA